MATPQEEHRFGPSKPPDRSLGFMFPRVAHSLDRDFEEMLATFGIRSSHLGLLSTLRAYGALSQRQVARYLGLERQTMVNVTDALEKRGMVERRDSPEDRRVQLLHLTPQGIDFQNKVDAAAEEHERRIFGVLSDEEQEALYKILLKLAPIGHFETLLTPPYEA